MKQSRIKIPLELVESLRKEPMSDEIRMHISTTAELFSEECDWIKIKKIILLSLAPADRQLFSRRDDRTRLHKPFNAFEQQVRNLWHELTGKTLVMPQEKRMINTTEEDYL